MGCLKWSCELLKTTKLMQNKLRWSFVLRCTQFSGFSSKLVPSVANFKLNERFLITVLASLSKHPWGTSKWQLNGGWPLSRGLSWISIIFTRKNTLFLNSCATGAALLKLSVSSTWWPLNRGDNNGRTRWANEKVVAAP